jgi:hypothetical protein
LEEENNINPYSKQKNPACGFSVGGILILWEKQSFRCLQICRLQNQAVYKINFAEILCRYRGIGASNCHTLQVSHQ